MIQNIRSGILWFNDSLSVLHLQIKLSLRAKFEMPIYVLIF